MAPVRGQQAEADPGPDVLLAQVEADRERFAATIDTLIERTQPRALGEQAKQRVTDHLRTEQGGLRTEVLIRVGLISAGLLGSATALWWLRRRLRR